MATIAAFATMATIDERHDVRHERAREHARAAEQDRRHRGVRRRRSSPSRARARCPCARCGRWSASFSRHRITSSASAAARRGGARSTGCGVSPMCAASSSLRRLRDERRPPGEQLVRHAAERVDVGAVVGRGIGRRLLGRHVRRRADRRADLRQRAARLPRASVRAAPMRLRDAEVGDGRRCRRRAARCPA